MRIALGQIDCRLGNLPYNCTRHEDVLKIAAESNADLTVFPELSLTGYRLRSNIHRAMLTDNDFLHNCGKVSSVLQEGTFATFGYVEVSERSVLHNSTVILESGNDQPIFRHRKVYLPTYGMFEEARYARPGLRIRTIDLTMRDGETWRIGILCCEDAWHSTAWAIMQAYGADLIIVPSASPGRGVESDRLGSQKSWYGILSTHAELSGCWVAYCNRVGFEDDIHFWGGSSIFAPTGEMTAQAGLMDEETLIHDISRRAVTTARISTPIIADENWDMISRELNIAMMNKESEN
ncbi:MAG: nitrilase-related carbon-nitrogen hydrolase [bacterium]